MRAILGALTMEWTPIVVLGGDPASDVSAFSKVGDVVRDGGKLIYRAPH